MFLEKFLAQFTWLDWVGLIWFLTCWLGYEQVVEKGWSGRKSLLEETHKLRLQWGRVMLTRNPRIVDVALINNLLQSLSFYANTSIYIIAALFAALGALDQLMALASDLPFARSMSREATEIKLLILIGIFVVAYFKFTWSLRQFNLLSILVGAAPTGHPDDPGIAAYARRVAGANSLAGDDFNRGIRAYYFGLAAAVWLLNPLICALASLAILVVLYRRDYRSPALAALRQDGT